MAKPMDSNQLFTMNVVHSARSTNFVLPIRLFYLFNDLTSPKTAGKLNRPQTIQIKKAAAPSRNALEFNPL